MTCKEKETQYFSNGHCCDKCPSGQHVVKDCYNSTIPTECAKCKKGQFSALRNGLKSCQLCTACSSDNNLVVVTQCTREANTVCECKHGYYCSNDNCDHCVQAKKCSEGEGVQVKASRTNNTICEPCQHGTYSNVTDLLSPCTPHTRCECLGRTLKTAGTSKVDAVCGDLLPATCKEGPCRWELPAGLWAGLVLTAALILFAVVIYRKVKRRSYRAGKSSRSVTLVKPLDLSLPITSLDLSLPDPKGTGYCQETCTVEEFKLPLFSQDENLVSCSVDSSLPITPLKVSVSFAEANYNNKGTGYCPGNFLRMPSEPQEDEWCGT